MNRTLHRIQTGYCTNVHAGRELASVLDNLQSHSADVLVRMRANRSGDRTEELGVGLWFSEVSANEALEPDNLLRLSKELNRLNLIPFTLNGFPQGDFHQRVVKHRVYLPTWWDEARVLYTSNLISILDALLPTGYVGSISTLPIAWGKPLPSVEQLNQSVGNLRTIAQQLAQLYERTGRYITLCLEPEPGCLLTDSPSFRQFYLDHLLPSAKTANERKILLQHITLCHDICHAAVMFEDQAVELEATKRAGIKIGKVQVSSAVQVDWSSLDGSQREQAWKQLSGFVEDRYLHQTCLKTRDGIQLIEDLPKLLEQYGENAPTDGSWRVHFHVPIFLESLGSLESTQSEIQKCLGVLLPEAGKEFFPTGHLEVETYAWPVLPKSLQSPRLSEGIAKEIIWFEEQIDNYQVGTNT